MDNEYLRNEDFYKLCESFILPSQISFPKRKYDKNITKFEIIQAGQIWNLWREKINSKLWYMAYSKQQLWQELFHYLLDHNIYYLEDDILIFNEEDNENYEFEITRFQILPYECYPEIFINELFENDYLENNDDNVDDKTELKLLRFLQENNYVIYENYFVLSPDDLLKRCSSKYDIITIFFQDYNIGTEKDRKLLYAKYDIPYLLYFGINCLPKIKFKTYVQNINYIEYWNLIKKAENNISLELTTSEIIRNENTLLDKYKPVLNPSTRTKDIENLMDSYGYLWGWMLIEI